MEGSCRGASQNGFQQGADRAGDTVRPRRRAGGDRSGEGRQGQQEEGDGQDLGDGDPAGRREVEEVHGQGDRLGRRRKGMGERHGAGRGEFCGDGGVNGASRTPSPTVGRDKRGRSRNGRDARCPSAHTTTKSHQKPLEAGGGMGYTDSHLNRKAGD